jgi:hypothetical protein
MAAALCPVAYLLVAYPLGSCSGLLALHLHTSHVACFNVRQRGRCRDEREPNVMIRLEGVC